MATMDTMARGRLRLSLDMAMDMDMDMVMDTAKAWRRERVVDKCERARPWGGQMGG